MDGRAAIESIHKRIGHIVVPYKCYVLVWGGFNEVTGRTTDSTYCPADIVWFYNCHNGMWISAQTTGNIPEKTSGSSAAISDDYLYIFGGIVEPEEERRPQMHRNYLHRLHLPSLRWEKLLPRGSAPPSSDKGVGWAYNGRIYFFGGYGPRPDPSAIDFVFQQDFTNGRMGWNNNLFGYDPENNSWFKPNTKGSTPDPRAAHAVSVMSGRAFIFGGRLGDSRTNDMYCLNMSTLTWSLNLNNPSTGPEGRSWLSFNFVSPKKAVVYGGLRQYGIAAMDYWECEFSDDYERLEWTKCVAPIEPRVWHQGAFCQSTGELIIIGGVSKSPYEMGEEADDAYITLELDSESPLESPQPNKMDENPVGSQSPAQNSTLNMKDDVSTKSSNLVTTSAPQNVDLIDHDGDAKSNSCDSLNSADSPTLTYTLSYNEDVTHGGGIVREPMFGSTNSNTSSNDSSECQAVRNIQELNEESDINEYVTHGDVDILQTNSSTVNSILETTLNNSFSFLETSQLMVCISFEHDSDSNSFQTVENSACALLEIPCQETNDSSFIKDNINEHQSSLPVEFSTVTPTSHPSDDRILKENIAPRHKNQRLGLCRRTINFDIPCNSETQIYLIDQDSNSILTENRYSHSEAYIPRESLISRIKGLFFSSNHDNVPTNKVDTSTTTPRTHRVPEIQVLPSTQMLPSDTGDFQPNTANFETYSTPHQISSFSCASPVDKLNNKPSFESYTTPENFKSNNLIPKCPNSEGMVSSLGIKSSRSRRLTSNTLETPCSHKENSKVSACQVTGDYTSPSSLSFVSTGDLKKIEILSSKMTTVFETMSPFIRGALVSAAIMASPIPNPIAIPSVLLNTFYTMKKMSESPIFQKSSPIPSPNKLVLDKQ